MHKLTFPSRTPRACGTTPTSLSNTDKGGHGVHEGDPTQGTTRPLTLGKATPRIGHVTSTPLARINNPATLRCQGGCVGGWGGGDPSLGCLTSTPTSYNRLSSPTPVSCPQPCVAERLTARLIARTRHPMPAKSRPRTGYSSGPSCCVFHPCAWGTAYPRGCQ